MFNKNNNNVDSASKFWRSLRWFLSAFLFISTTVFAQEGTENNEADAPLLAPVEVSVPGQETRVVSTSILDNDDINGQHIMNMNDVLFSMIPGVNTARKSNHGWMGNNSGFRLRGEKGTRVAVYVDGIPSQVNNHFHPVVDQYSPDFIERIEVIRGPSVLTHGASAVGGAIDVFTFTPQNKGGSGYFSVSGGEFDTTEIQGRANSVWDGGYATFSLSDRSTDGYRPNQDYDAQTLNFKVAADINNQWQVGLRLGSTRSNIEDPNNGNFFSQDPDNYALTFDNKTENSNSLIALYNNSMQVSDLNGNGVNPNPFISFDESETGIRATHTWIHTPTNTTTVGLDTVTFDDERTLDSGSTYVTNEESFSSLYVRQIQPLSDTVIIDGGIRATTSSQFGENVSPEVGIIKSLGNSLALRARAGTAFRVPRVNDVFNSGGTPSPDLEPEEFTHYEIGVNKKFGSRSILDVTVWSMDGDNLITRVAGVNTNTGEFSHQGIELTLNYRISSSLELLVAAAALDMENNTKEIPARTLDVGVDYRSEKWRVNVTSRAAQDISDGALADYFVADVHIAYAATKNVTVFGDIENITDEEYETIAGYPQTPQSFFAGVRVEF